MKKLFLFLSILGFCCVSHAATLTAGYNFATNEVVTAAKLATLVNSATLSSISASDLSDGLINNAKLGADSVTSDKIQDGTITANDIKSYTLSSSLYGTNSVQGFTFATNMTIGLIGSTNTWVFTNAFTTLNFNGPSTTLNFNTNQIPGFAVSNAVNKVSTNINLSVDTALPNGSWTTNMFPYTTQLGSNAFVDVVATGGIDGTAALDIRISDGVTTTFGGGIKPGQAGNYGICHWRGILSSNVTMQVYYYVNTGAVTLKKSMASNDFIATNATSVLIYETK